MKRVCLLVAGSTLVALVAFLTAQVHSAMQGAAFPQTSTPTGSSETKRPDDQAAVRRATADLVAALEKGDARAVAAAWTEEGEYVGADGTTLRGRAAIEAAYARDFANKKNAKVEISADSIRFPSKDTSIQEGYAKSFKAGSEQPTISRYSMLHVREGGHWLIAMLREWPDEGDSLRDLGWLIGAWEAKNDDAEVRTTYEWGPQKNSIRCQFTIKGPSGVTSGMQVLLRDPRNGQLHSWLFDDDGGFGDATWTRDGKHWVIAAHGVQADGDELTATNILMPIDKDSFTWQSTERTLDGVELPNIRPVKVGRVK